MPQDSSSSDPTLSKLLDADADLATQEAGLLAQLQEVQEKRKSLQIVVGLFAPNEQAQSPAPVPVPVSSNEQAPALEETVDAAAESVPEAPNLPQSQEAPSPAPEVPAAKDQEETPAPRQRPSTSTKQSGKAKKQHSQNKPKAPAKTGGRGESWRPYVREDFPENAPLAEMAAAVMKRLPERSFTVPEIMGAIFTEDIPQSQYDTAKGRLFTVLSEGIKEGRWVRPDKGQYRAPA